MKRTLCLTSILSVVAALGCGDGGPGAGPNRADAGAQSDAAPEEPNTPDASGTCIPTGDVDDPDPGGADDNCDGADGVIGVDVYVDGALGADTNVGLPHQPLRTLDSAIKLASSRGGRVLIANGMYDVAQLGAKGAYALYGGYAASFVGKRKRDQTVLRATTSAGILLEEADQVRFQTLTVEGRDATEADQPTAHALRVDVAKLELVDVVVRAGNALAGTTLGSAGDAGEPGMDGKLQYSSGALSCNGQVQPGYSGGAEQNKANSQGGKPGNCITKTPAAAGKPGLPGSEGAHASKEPGITSEGLLRWAAGATAPNDATPGFGGAGGGLCSGIVQAGGGATGGCPGGPGAGGDSGGGAVAILMLGGSLHMQGVLLTTGFAGNGGSGAEGGPGGNGGKGAKPNCYLCTATACDPSSDAFGCAAWGGAGGPGGAGGRGGAGAGGWTIGVVTTAAATVEFDAATTFTLGLPGKGADGASGTRAPDGEKRKTVHVESTP